MPRYASIINIFTIVINIFILPSSSGKKARVTIGVAKKLIAAVTHADIEKPIKLFTKEGFFLPLLSIFPP